MRLIKNDYYEEEFRYKNRDELLRSITGLKNEIEQLKNILEHPSYTIDPDIEMPDYKARLLFARESLKRAIGVLIQGGGIKEVSKEDINSQNFEECTPYINELSLRIENIITGSVLYTAKLESNIFRLKAKYSFLDNEDDVASITKQEFIEKISDLHIGEWRRNYSLSRFGYPDNEEAHWDLEISFSTDDPPVRIHGAGVHPYNYNNLLGMFNPRFLNEK